MLSLFLFTEISFSVIFSQVVVVLKVMRLFVSVDLEQVKECQLCGQHILFVERREGGTWFPTDAIQDEDSGLWGYLSRGPNREVALFHRCYGDPGDPTTINGRKAEYKTLIDDIHKKFEDLQIKEIISPDNGEYSDEYKRLVDEYTGIRERFSDILSR
jgi:hypothetical protein